MTPVRQSWWNKLTDGLLSTPAGSWLILNVLTSIDPLLLRWTGGRFSTPNLIGVPVALLTTTGAKSGKPRQVAVLYVADGEKFALIASQTGLKRHPGWYHNLKANPQAEVLCRSYRGAVIAREAAPPERERLWQIAQSIYSGFEVYKMRAGQRQIPIMVLEPKK